MSHIFKLLNKTLVSVEGKNRINFLQRIITKNIERLEENELGLSYSCLLNPRGRIVSDIFLYKIRDEVLIECSQASSSSVLNFFNKYKMRESVTFHVNDNLNAYQACQAPETDILDVEVLKTPLLSDPRTTALGYKFLAERNANILKESCSKIKDEFAFMVWRYGLGICEGSDIPEEQAIPHEYNMDKLNALSFDKGCYIGQEMVARTNYSGEVRKRIVPIRIVTGEENLDSLILMGKEVLARSGKTNEVFRAGKVVAVHNCQGCGLIRLKYISPDWNLFINTKGEEEIKIEANVPGWWNLQ